MREDFKVKFVLQALKNKKAVFDAVYRRVTDDSDYDVYDQIFADFQIKSPKSKAVIVSPYFCDEGNRVIFSYPGYSRLHTMFKNICAREKIADFDNLPT